jgi:acyl-coenzyme A thioesterase PaaI-like protein
MPERSHGPEGTPDNLEARRQFYRDMFHVTPVCKTTGFKMHYDDAGSAVIALAYNQGLDHPLGCIFGGILSSMMDFAGFLTVAPHYENWLTTLEYSTRILEQVKAVNLSARGIMRKLGRAAAFADMEVYSGDEHRLVATGSGVFHVTSRPLAYKELVDLTAIAGRMGPDRIVY